MSCECELGGAIQSCLSRDEQAAYAVYRSEHEAYENRNNYFSGTSFTCVVVHADLVIVYNHIESEFGMALFDAVNQVIDYPGGTYGGFAACFRKFLERIDHKITRID